MGLKRKLLHLDVDGSGAVDAQGGPTCGCISCLQHVMLSNLHPSCYVRKGSGVLLCSLTQLDCCSILSVMLWTYGVVSRGCCEAPCKLYLSAMQICLLPFGILACVSMEESYSCWRENGRQCTVIKWMCWLWCKQSRKPFARNTEHVTMYWMLAPVEDEEGLQCSTLSVKHHSMWHSQYVYEVSCMSMAKAYGSLVSGQRPVLKLHS